jgi:transcription antitermination factor NusG
VTQWFVIKTVPIHRIEFSVAARFEQFGSEALVPFETKWVKRGNRKSRDEKRYPLFPTYVISSFDSLGDYLKMKYAINRLAEDTGKRPPIMGAIGYGANPANLTAEEVSWLRGMVPTPSKTTALHRSLAIGGRAEIVKGAFAGQIATVSSLDKRRARVMLTMFGQMHVVEINDMSSLVAA